MLTEIDGLKMPPSIESYAELFNQDSQRRTVSNRLITKTDGLEKWRVTCMYETDALTIEFQKAFYEKCAVLRNTAKTIKFISPYDGVEKAITAKMISRNNPRSRFIIGRKPKLYTQVGAVFEEV